MSFPNPVGLVAQGAPVAAGVVNRPSRDLEVNIQYLYDLIQAASLGSAIFARQVTIEAAAQVGMPVFLNSTTQQFERALAQLQTDTASGQLLTAPSALVWGVVYSKTNATLADLVVFGYVELDITAAVGSAPAQGTYYLSGSTPGGLVAQRPPVSVPVLRSDGNGKVFVQPQFVDFLDSHRHYRFDLACYPAGNTSPPLPGEPHTISSPDPTKPGWLPADHAVFAGKAPGHAKFGYNLALHPQLANNWPPLPLDSVYFEWNRGGDYTVGGQGVPMGSTPQIVADRNGIWWMTDCWRDVPWPPELNTLSPGSETVSENLDSPGGDGIYMPPDSDGADFGHCPRVVAMELTVWFTKLTFTTDATAVTSLVSSDNRLKVVCQGTNTPASTGPLEIELDLSFLVTTTTLRGSTTLKTLTGGNEFGAGPVCEGVYAVSGNVTLVSDVPTITLNPDDTGPTVYQGLVGISVASQPTLQLNPILTRLHGATEEFFLGAMYLGMAAGEESSYVTEFHVPDDLQIPNPKFHYQLRLLGLTTGQLPQLTFSVQIVSRPVAGLVTPLTLTSTSASVTMPTQGILSAPNQFVEAVSNAITVSPGDIVLLTVTRSASDGYAGDVGILAQVGQLAGS